MEAIREIRSAVERFKELSAQVPAELAMPEAVWKRLKESVDGSPAGSPLEGELISFAGIPVKVFPTLIECMDYSFGEMVSRGRLVQVVQ